MFRYRKVCAFVVITEEPYSLYIAYISYFSAKYSMCLIYFFHSKATEALVEFYSTKRKRTHVKSTISQNYRRDVREKNRADLPDHLGKVLPFFYKNNMENWTCLNFVT